MALTQEVARQHLHSAAMGDANALDALLRALVEGDFLGTLTATELAFIDGLTAGTAAASKALVTNSAIGIGGGWRDTRATPVFNQGAAGALNATGTLTAALMMGGIVTSTTAAAVTATLDTGTLLETDLIAAYPGLAVSDYFEFSVINTGATNAFTIATAAGWTDGGNGFAAVALSSSARFGVRRTAANTYTIFKVG